jgi:hypothetical protein
MNKTLAIAGGIALFSMGVLAGLFLRQDRSEPRRNAAPEVQRPALAPETKARSGPPPAGADVPTLEARVRELEAEIRGFHGAPAKSDGELTPAALEELFKASVALREDKHADPEKARIVMGRLSQLNEKSAAYFIDLYRRSNTEDSEHERPVALELALASGGPAAAEFIQALLKDPTLDPILRANLLLELSGLSGSFFSIRRLPVDESFAGTAMSLSQSDKPEERQAGAGLLGGVPTEASRAELMHLIEQDPETRVKTAAALSLGHVGSASTRTFLEAYWISQLPTFKGQEGARLRNAIESTLKQLAER